MRFRVFTARVFPSVTRKAVSACNSWATAGACQRSYWKFWTQAVHPRLDQRFPNIAGFQYYEGERLFKQLNIGDPLQLRRAPENKYDKRAVGVYWKNNMLGHIPKVANMSISQILDNSGELNAKITRLYPQQKPWYCVDLVVYLDSNQRNSA